MNRRDLLKIGMKGILVAPLIAMGMKVLLEEEEIYEVEEKNVKNLYDGGNSKLTVYINDKELEANIFARVKITFGSDENPPIYEFEYLDENEL